MANNGNVTLDTLIAIKIQFQGQTKKFKIPLRDLGAQVLPGKLRTFLQITPDEDVVFERYSDSAGAYVTLDSDKPQVYKTLFRAAKAKLKLRLRATLVGDENAASSSPPAAVYTEPTLTPYAQHINATPVSPLAEPSPAIAHSPPATYAKGKQAVDIEEEAPVPRPFPARERYLNDLADVAHNLAFRPKEPELSCSWVVYCNRCEQPIESDHFHCSICENGDYDLCSSCLDSGVHCPDSSHWMVRRFVRNGTVVNSTTERVGPKPKVVTEKEMPGAFKDERKNLFEPEEPTRTCNCCVKVFPENEFVSCTSCEDYDLCLDCHNAAKHGHHPGHVFQGATAETKLTAVGEYLCNSGRNVRHSAVCDGCEKFIFGVRHKCLNCPDWDFCSECIKNAKYIHPRHRFVPIYEPLTEPNATTVRHYGIYCDGPLCQDKENVSYIEGVRYKCAICNDTDFCANCEAFPNNRHNRTHPLIKFKTPVRSVSVTTMGEDKNGVALARLGDQPGQKSAATETIPVAPSSNAATQVQTIVDLKPTEETQQSKPNKEKIEIKDLLSEPIHKPEPTQEKIKVADLLTTAEACEETTSQPAQPEVSATPNAETKKPELDAHFIRDTITDGTKVFAGFQFVQVWTLRNPGPLAWPAGCSVRHVGGDNMLNLDNTQPFSHSEFAEASESNVMGRPVEVGEEISFRIVMRAPKREGTAISYWRLKTADGIPFGHRLWCDIQVTTPPAPITQSSPVPEPSSSNSNPRVLIPERLLKANEQMAKGNVRTQIPVSVEQNATPIEQSEQERMLQIQQFRKAALERLYESRRKSSAEMAAVEATKRNSVNTSPAEVPIKSEPIEQEPAQKEPLRELRPQASGMIFPQLDKESPVSSTHEAISPKSESQQIESDAAPAATASESGEEFFEDAESVEILDSSSDDGFMTDEEYDILDASDEEMP